MADVMIYYMGKADYRDGHKACHGVRSEAWRGPARRP